jgi:hypothetical protein
MMVRGLEITKKAVLAFRKSCRPLTFFPLMPKPMLPLPRLLLPRLWDPMFRLPMLYEPLLPWPAAEEYPLTMIDDAGGKV